MRVIICGAGQVGYNIAAYLAREDNDITIVDLNPDTITKVNENLDVRGIVGHASNPDVLSSAGASDADIIIAVTNSDEVNMVACQVGHSLFNVPKKIARLREKAYLDPAWANLFSRAHMPIDVIISPEIEVANAIVQRLSVPGTTNVVPLAEGKVYLCSVLCEKDCPIVNTPIRQLNDLFPDILIKVVSIFRGTQSIIPTEEEQMLIGDEVYFVVSAQHLSRALSTFGHEEKTARHVVMVGGGSIGAYAAEQLQKVHTEISIKIIEQNPRKAEQLSAKDSGIVVICGDALERSILEEANIAQAETIVAVTDDDEANILTSLLARQYGCNRAVTLVNRNIYSSLTGTLGIGAIVSPRAITVSTIMQHVRRGRIKAVHNIRDGFAEVIEAEVSETSAIANRTIQSISFPKDVVVGAVVRENEVLMSKPDLVIRPHDEIIVLAAQGAARKVENMFSVQVDLF